MDSLFLRRERKQSRIGDVFRVLLRNRWLTAGVGLGLAFLGLVLFGSRGVVQRIRLEREQVLLQEQLRVEEARERRLRAQLQALRARSPGAVEKAARERHNMIRPGETVYKIRREE